jgi:hypothetical protein
MYKLELDDRRLFLPVAVYECEGGEFKYCTAPDVPRGVARHKRVFFAPDRSRAGTVPVHERRDVGTGAAILTTVPYDVSTGKPTRVAFYAIPAGSSDRPPQTAALYEYVHKETGDHIYVPEEHTADTSYVRTRDPICRVWVNPIQFDPFDVAP